MRIFLSALLLVFSLPLSIPAQDAACVGWRCAFEQTDPARPPAPEDVFDPDFDLIFGPEPSGPANGGRWNMRHKAAIVQWSQARQNFAALSDAPLNPDNENIVMIESGGVPIVWSDHDGALYVAVIGGPARITNYPFLTFNKIPPFTAASSVVYSMLRKGGCFERGLPARYVTPAASVLNDRNCGQ